MKKFLMTVAAVAGVLSAVADDPSVTNVVISQDADVPAIIVSYTLTNGPAVVTLDDICVDGVSIGAANFRDQVFGDVHMKVPSGERKIVWRADRSWPGHAVATDKLSAKISVWKPATPPDYLVVDLAPETCCRQAYYSSTNMLPGGLGHLDYRTKKIVMRRIPAKDVTWRMGSNTDDPYRVAAAEYPHLVKLTQDYYIGVFPLTLGQFIVFNGEPLSYHTTYLTKANYESFPVNYLPYKRLRGPWRAATGWPTGGHDVLARDPDSGAETYLGKLRTLTGVAFDLPTDAQWEFACRAGTGESFSCGKFQKDGSPKYYADGTSINDVTTASTSNWELSLVDKYHPNAWGLYDVHGNCTEWVLDAYSDGADYIATFGTGATEQTVVVDPKGPTPSAAPNRVARSCNWRETEPTMGRSSARRNGYSEGTNGDTVGCRLTCPIGIAAW